GASGEAHAQQGCKGDASGSVHGDSFFLNEWINRCCCVNDSIKTCVLQTASMLPVNAAVNVVCTVPTPVRARRRRSGPDARAPPRPPIPRKGRRADLQWRQTSACWHWAQNSAILPGC